MRRCSGALVCLLAIRCVAHPCESEVSSACPDRPGAELARCLKDKNEHESPTEISSACADFIAVNAACAEDISKFCDEAFFSEDTALCLSTWISPEDLSPKCAGVLSWALPKAEATEDGPTDELGLSEKDYAEKREWQAKRKAGRSAAIEKIRQDRQEEEELEALKKEDPAAYKQLLKEREEAKRSFEELKKRKRLLAAAEERKRRKAMGLPDLAEEETEEEEKKRKRMEERLEMLREAKKKERVNWLPYVLGGLFVAYLFFNVLNVFGGKSKKNDDDDDDKDD
mmetsp:Transcript_1423/g.3629  ORF Transcript_1423/g.3629 Transcript_1423/m.3629 type:complete len:284 (-) Transcript_1423:148-999(-)